MARLLQVLMLATFIFVLGAMTTGCNKGGSAGKQTFSEEEIQKLQDLGKQMRGKK